MTQVKMPVNNHDHYHAHVYFDQTTLMLAESLCQQAGDKFAVKVGRVHQNKVGPHPKWSCQILFSKKEFDQLIPWLDENRQNLSILVHAQTGNDLQDHTEFAYWLGQPVPLILTVFNGH